MSGQQARKRPGQRHIGNTALSRTRATSPDQQWQQHWQHGPKPHGATSPGARTWQILHNCTLSRTRRPHRAHRAQGCGGNCAFGGWCPTTPPLHREGCKRLPLLRSSEDHFLAAAFFLPFFLGASAGAAFLPFFAIALKVAWRDLDGSCMRQEHWWRPRFTWQCASAWAPGGTGGLELLSVGAEARGHQKALSQAWHHRDA